MIAGNATFAPWPFRVRSGSGIWFNSKSSNTVYALKLFYRLIHLGYTEFQEVLHYFRIIA
jgi:hypothetical protein